MAKHFHAAIATAIVVSATTVAASSVAAETVQFTDITKEHSHYEAIMSLANRGIINGYSDGTFKAEATLTRAQAAKILAGVLKLDTSNKTATFTDVPATSEHVGAINALLQHNVINGYSDGTFKPNAPLTRGQMAKILVGAFALEQAKNVELPFTDVSADNGYRSSIQTLVNYSITNGKTATTYAPSESVTRGQMASFIMRAENAELVAKESYTTLTVSDVLANTLETTAGTYTYAKTLAPIFQADNKQALANATLTVKTNGTVITEVRAVQLNAGGTAEQPAVLKDAHLTSVTVNANYVELRNVQVAEDVSVTENAVDKFSAIQTTIAGELVIQPQNRAQASTQAPQGKNDTWLYVYLTNSTVNTIEAFRNQTIFNGDRSPGALHIAQQVRHVHLLLPVDVLTVSTASDVKIEGAAAVKLLNILDARVVELALASTIEQVNVGNTAIALVVDKKTKIKTLAVPENSKAQEIVQNYSAIRKSISEVVTQKVNAETKQLETIVIAKNTGGGGGGGGGGSSSAPTQPALQAQPVIITAVSDLQQTITIGETITLPATVEATMSDGTKKSVQVTWDKTDTQLTTTGETIYEGTIQDYATKVKYVVTVNEANKDALTALLQTIQYAAVSTDGKDIEPTALWTTAAVKEGLQEASDIATAVVQNKEATAAQIAVAVTSLDGAIAAYKAAQQLGTKTAPVVLVKDALQTALANVTNYAYVAVSVNGEDVEPAFKWTTAQQKADLQNAIAAAQTVLATATTQEELDTAVTNLQAAVVAYENAKQVGRMQAKAQLKVSSTVAIDTTVPIDLYISETVVEQVTIASVADSGAHELTITFEQPFDVSTLTNTVSFTYNGTAYIATYANSVWTLSVKPAVAVPTNVLVESGKNSVTLTWDSVQNAHSYTIYRAEQQAGNYTQIAKNIASATYVDSGLVTGQTYYYKVAAVTDIGEGQPTIAVDVTANIDDFGPVYRGNYVVVSNTATSVSNAQSTGAITVTAANVQANRLGNAQQAAPLAHEAYRMNPILTEPMEFVTTDDTVKFNVTGTTTSYAVGDKKLFWISNVETGKRVQEEATLVHIGTHAEVWVHQASITAAQAKQMADEFDANIYPVVTNNFGAAPDIDNNGRIAILTLDIQDGYNGGTVRSYVGGYFSGNDLYPNSMLATKISNEMEIVYIDTYPTMGTNKANLDVKAAYSTVVHEFQHLVNAYQEYFVENKRSDVSMATWLDEALSMAAEHMYEDALVERISYFNSSAAVKNGRSVIDWNNSEVLANYALSYLFGQYLRIQANEGYIAGQQAPGTAIYRELLTHTGTDKEALESIIHKYIDPTMSLGEFLHAFRLALVLKAETGLYGFGGETAFNSLATQVYTGGAITLDGGGAIVIETNGGTVEAPSSKGEDITFTGVYTP